MLLAKPLNPPRIQNYPRVSHLQARMLFGAYGSAHRQHPSVIPPKCKRVGQGYYSARTDGIIPRILAPSQTGFFGQQTT